MSEVITYDAVIVGAGVAGSILAQKLTNEGLRVLLLEAGSASARSLEGYEGHLATYYNAASKGPESPWPPETNAPQPDTVDLRQAQDNLPDPGKSTGYFIQKGPNLYGSSYSRLAGGSTLHWLGVSLRMLPHDLKIRTLYGVGLDWPLSYDQLEPYYRQAERELGVSADVAEQDYHGLKFAPGYDFPMKKVPPSYSDQKLAESIDGMAVEVGGDKYNLKVRTYPAARNSTPRGDYQPVGAVDARDDGLTSQPYEGERCQGNTSCTPICPVQAKYNAGKSLARASRENLQVLSKAVASKINIDNATGEVLGITYQRYDGTNHTVHEAKGRVYVLAAHAVENAKLMLASGLNDPKELVGGNLMDHPALYAWGLAPESVGAYRGPQSTGGIEDLRDGPFRSKHAPFRFDVGNDGWKATTGAPDASVKSAVGRKLFGKKLRSELESTLPRHVRFSLAIEQLPSLANRVTIDRQWLDPLGNPRPVINYHIDDYTIGGMAAATKVAQEIFKQAKITDFSDSKDSAWFPLVKHGETTYYYHGMGHFAGTHVMGTDESNSVVNDMQRSWNHHNLFLLGSGSFPTMGTSNPTLTLAALAIRTAEHIVAELKK
jgi:choline dehydrogenase-like flavoprotein